MMQTFSFSPRIKLKRSYHTNYGSSFYQFHQLELFICTSILVFKHILYTTIPYISNAKIDYNFICPSFQYTQLQHFCPQILQQCAGYSTSTYSGGPLSFMAFRVHMREVLAVIRHTSHPRYLDSAQNRNFRKNM